MDQDLCNLLSLLDAAAVQQTTTEDMDIDAIDEIVNEYINHDHTAQPAPLQTQDDLGLPENFDLLGADKIIDDYLNMESDQSWPHDFFFLNLSLQV